MLTRAPSDMLLPIAEHEAGHVVMAFALGIEVVTVASFPGRTLGGPLHENLLAGLYNHGPPIPPPRPRHSCAIDGDLPDDLWEAYRFADMLNGTDAARATIGSLVSRAVDILWRNQEPARAIAETLHEAGTLSGEAARAIWLAHGACLEPEAALSSIT
jgi:hypothetical protein